MNFDGLFSYGHESMMLSAADHAPIIEAPIAAAQEISVADLGGMAAPAFSAVLPQESVGFAIGA